MKSSSDSQRMTKPLKLIGKAIKWFAMGSYHWLTFSPTSRPRRIIKNLLLMTKYYINANPKLKIQIIRILQHFPSLAKALNSITPPRNIKLLHEQDKLCYRAQIIYDEMKDIFSTRLSKPNIQNDNQIINKGSKPKLAIVTPFPPDRTGIADYTAELIPALSKIYDIDIITEHKNEHKSEEFAIQSIEFLKINHSLYDRVIYQIGNSPYHAYMFELIKNFPGIVVLHDFYLGNLIHWMQGNYPNADYIWDSILLDDYGYAAQVRKNKNSTRWAAFEFPANAHIFRDALGIIVHSKYAKSLTDLWYGSQFDHKIHILPQVHSNIHHTPSLKQKHTNEEFLVCSFGHLTKTKLIHTIISAWTKSNVGKNQNNRLLFVGSLEHNEYAIDIKNLLRSIHNIEITGFVDDKEFKRLLGCADLAVQLRSESRGETSRAVLDCMAYGIPTIINANGSMVEFPDNAVYKLRDKFYEDELITALDQLYADHSLAHQLSEVAQETIASVHEPQKVAIQLDKILENIYSTANNKTLLEFCTDHLKHNKLPNTDELKQLAKQFDIDNRSDQSPAIYVDISALAIHDLKTGIQRVVRSILNAMLDMSFKRYKIIPVYLTDTGGYWHYRIAHAYMHCFISDLMPRFDTVIEPSAYDIFLGLDYYANAITQAANAGLYREWIGRGVDINFVVYDILPIQLPHFFPSTSFDEHLQWLQAISHASTNLLCISKTVANEVEEFLKNSKNDTYLFPCITSFHLGADIDNSIPSKGMPENSAFVLNQLKSIPTFLSVGTVEPRKGHKQTLSAFEKLWTDSTVDANFVIVGKLGWMMDDFAIKIKSHPELNKRLFWLEGISDEYLENVYRSSACLIAASEGEGFGLPLIEAAQKKLPIIARDIPVFHEVAGEHAYYFENSNEPSVLSDTIKEWMELYKSDTHPKSYDMPWLTWKESAESLFETITRTKT